MYRNLAHIRGNFFLKTFAKNALDVLESGSFWDLTSAFRALLLSDAPAKIINAYLDDVRARPDTVHGSASETNWSFLDFGSFALSFTILTPELESRDKPLTTLPNDHFVGVVGDGSIHVRLYEVEEGCGDTNSEPTLIEAINRHMHRGDHCELHAGKHAYRFAAGEKPAVLMILSSAARLATTTLFQADSQRFLCAVAANPGDSRIEVAAKILADLKAPGSVAALATLQKHPSHFVRWTALRCLGAISPADALPLLRSAVNDSHPHVREAAAKTLSRVAHVENA